MSTPLELATTAATGIVGAMTSKAWTHIRERCVTLLRAHLDAPAQDAALTRLDQQQKALVATSAESRAPIAGLVTQETAQVLGELLRRSPEAAGPLRSLQEEARSATASDASVISNIKVENVKSKGSVNVSGGNMHLNGEQS